MLEEIFPISLRGEGDREGAFPVSPKFLGCSPSMRARARASRWRTAPGAQLSHPARRSRHPHPQCRPPRARSPHRHPCHPHPHTAPRPRSARRHACRVDRPTPLAANYINGLRSKEGKVRTSDVCTPPAPGDGIGYSSGFHTHSGCSAWYSNDPGAGSGLGIPASRAASFSLRIASALRRVVS